MTEEELEEPQRPRPRRWRRRILISLAILGAIAFFGPAAWFGHYIWSAGRRTEAALEGFSPDPRGSWQTPSVIEELCASLAVYEVPFQEWASFERSLWIDTDGARSEVDSFLELPPATRMALEDFAKSFDEFLANLQIAETWSYHQPTGFLALADDRSDLLVLTAARWLDRRIALAVLREDHDALRELQGVLVARSATLFESQSRWSVAALIECGLYRAILDRWARAQAILGPSVEEDTPHLRDFDPVSQTRELVVAEGRAIRNSLAHTRDDSFLESDWLGEGRFPFAVLTRASLQHGFVNALEIYDKGLADSPTLDAFADLYDALEQRHWFLQNERAATNAVLLSVGMARAEFEECQRLTEMFRIYLRLCAEPMGAVPEPWLRVLESDGSRYLADVRELLREKAYREESRAKRDWCDEEPLEINYATAVEENATLWKIPDRGPENGPENGRDE